MCPWASFNTTDVTEKYDTMYGHFDFDGAQLKGAVHKSETSMQTLTETAPLVFSGHFHIRKEYPQRNGKLITIGAPAELDWGDTDNEKGFYTLDTESLEYEFHVNDFSPRHIKIHWSKLRQKQETLKNIKGNYVKLVIDEEYKFDKVMKVLNLINLKNPIKPCQTDFIYNNNFSNILDQFDHDSDEKIVTMSKLDYIKKFIDHAEDNLEDMNKDVLLNMVNEYYNLTLSE
jgi:DNA repair exonuclease SbcCD nuclease subunit